MILAKQCPFDGVTNFMEIPLSDAEFLSSWMAWENGTLIQDAFPTLSPDLREFIKTGITPSKWAEMFGDNEYYLTK